MSTSNLRDPVGLLARSPELAELAERAPALRRAIENGRPLDAYRALYWGHRAGRFKDRGDVAATLLARRRLFLKPITSAPVMMTFNGVGSSLYGRSDLDTNDGTYVATLFLVFVFVPVFPLASYLVRDGQTTGRRSWSFLAKVPLGTLTYLWQRAVALALLAVVGVGASHAFEGYKHNTLYVVNGLGRPVSVALSGSAATVVLAGEHAALRTTVGKHTLEVRDGDRPIESSTVDLPRGPSAVAWNVLGAAPVYLAQEVYTKEGSGSSGDGAPPEIFCGQSLIVRKDVEYVFATPPKTISMPEGSHSVVKSHMGVAPGGPQSCVAYLMSRGDSDAGARLAVTIARATHATAATMGDALEGALGILPAPEAEAFAKELLAYDDSLEANRLYQNVLLASDQRARAISEYDARLAAKPGADSEYLALRVRTNDEERKTVNAVVARYPEHAFLRRAQIFAHYAKLELPAVASACDALRSIDAKMWLRSIDQCIDALVGTGRGADALALLDRTAKDAATSPGDRRSAELLAYRVAHRIDAAAPELARDEGDDDDSLPVYARAVTGLPIEPAAIGKLKDEHLREALRVVLDARTNPDAALARLRKAQPMAFGRVPEAIRVLLLGEAARREDASDVAERMASLGFEKRGAQAMMAFVRSGAVSDEISDLSLEMRSALELARSRVASLSAKERAEVLALAKASDVLRGPVSVAIAGWAP